MRPERLEMVGFAPFRARTEVDFAGLDLFALTGPTGAGKSSVIDAMTFALYGSAPRYDRKSVGPVISLGAAEARIRFDFEVAGTGYTAVRVVRRTPSGGASTAEARLESGGATLASGAAEVTRAVESLLGLTMDHFTRSVVLPQGEFASFLHDTPSGQQDLVKALLDMGVLEVLRRSAGERARTAAALAQAARTRLEHMEDATEEAELDLARRVGAMEKLVEPVASGEEAIAEAEKSIADQEEDLADLRRQRSATAAIQPAAGVEELAEKMAATKLGFEEAARLAADADAAYDRLRGEAEGIPSADRLRVAADTFDQLAKARERLEGFDLDEMAAEVASAAEEVAAALVSRQTAMAEREQAHRRHAAHALLLDHHAGDPCPACRRPLEDDPEVPPADLEAAEAVAVASTEAYEAAVERQRRAETAMAECRAGHREAAAVVAELDSRLPDLPDQAELTGLLASRHELDRRLAEAELAAREARSGEAAARRRLAELEEGARRGWEQFAAERDKVAALRPPPADRQDLAAAWAQLLEWAGKTTEHLDDEVMAMTASIEEARSAVAKLQDELDRMLADHAIEGSGQASSRLAVALAGARADLSRLRERRAERDQLLADVAGFDETGQVASSLANHLKANRFEGWLLAEALTTLVEGANSLLTELTTGAYSLTLTERVIEVIDHRNADERRSVRSLSGGETFLVSLALALTLGEQLVTVSDRAGARLEAIFLDEGFGTLDTETLETVSVVVSELAAGGRIVGLVTHVKDLADQIPVRFDVRPGPGGSTIERKEG